MRARGWELVESPEMSPGDRLRLALDLYVTGEAIMRQNLRREFPSASEEEISDRLGAWLRKRPGAEHGDAVGKPGEWPRPTS